MFHPSFVLKRGFSSVKKWKLEGKNVVVTGGTHGIGLAIVEEFCQLGANVLTFSRSTEEAKTTESFLRSKDYNVFCRTADLSTRSGRELVFKETNKQFTGSLDCLVNNVGYNTTKKAVEYTDEDYATIMDTNVLSMFSLSQLLYPLLQRSSSGASIVNLGSVSGLLCR
jgi:NAD(P)-dependent dehydrogenase (short-subunit alcohol dehydrogenase family)